MLGYRHHPLTLLPKSIHDTQLADTFAVDAERAGAYHGILGIGVDVHHRSEVDMDTHHAALAANLLSHTVDNAVSIMVKLTEDCVAWETVHVLQSHSQSPFAIDAYQQRHLGVFLETLSHCSLPLGSADKKADATNLIAAHRLRKIGSLAVIHIQRHTHHHQLCDAFLKRQGVHHRVHPTALPLKEIEN